MTALRTSLFLISAVLLPPAAQAQGWTVSAAAGRAVHDPVSARIGSTVASLGINYAHGPARWLYLTAGGPLGDTGPAWGAGGVGGWLGVQRGDFTAGATLGGHAYGFGASSGIESGGGATVELMPTVTWARGPFRAELSSGFQGNAEAIGDSTERRGVFDSGARLSVVPLAGVTLTGEARYLRAEHGDWPYAGGVAGVERDRWSGYAYAGRWIGSDFPAPATAWGAGAGYRVDDRTRLDAGVRQEPMDPLYRSTPRRTWTVQVSRSLGRQRRDPAPPVLAPVVIGTTATFRLPRKEYPESPVLLGEFSRWQPVPMTADGDDWKAAVRLQPGVHRYAYRTKDGTTFVPPGVPSVDDGFGGASGVLVVP